MLDFLLVGPNSYTNYKYVSLNVHGPYNIIAKTLFTFHLKILLIMFCYLFAILKRPDRQSVEGIVNIFETYISNYCSQSGSDQCHPLNDL